MGKTTLNAFASILVAVIALLAHVNGRIYSTSDSIVFEIDRTWDGAFLAKSFPFTQSDFVPIKSFLKGGDVPSWQIPLVEPAPEVNSYENNYYLPPQQLGLNFYSWLYPPFVYYGGTHVIPGFGSRSVQPLKQQSKQNIRCGAGPNPNRIVNGTEATPNSWPFVAAFMKPGSGNVNCGGSLISENKILSAAHCFERKSMFQLSQMVVKLGMHNRGDGENVPDDAQMTRRISRMTIHKAYNTKSQYYDIAMITLDTPVAYSKSISPVCLAPASGEPDVYAGETASIMGWGRLKPDGAGSEKLMQSKVPIMTNAECKKYYPKIFDEQIVNHMLCAKSFPTSVCMGDSGGPLVVRSKDGLWTQAGIVSWGSGDCTSTIFPAAVYTRVNWLRGWINGNMRN